MPHDPTTIANYLVKEAEHRGIRLTPLKLQKLLYYVHGHAYSRLGRGAVNEPFEAWKYGPVMPSLYRWLKPYGAAPITTPVADPAAQDLEVVDPDLAQVASGVLEAYGRLDGSQLVALTHRPGTPWHQAYRDGTHWLGETIPDALIESYFRERDRAA